MSILQFDFFLFLFMMHNFFLMIYYIWRYFQHNHNTVDVPIKNLYGNFYQIMQTPNSFQKTGIAMSKYTPHNNSLRLINREFVENKRGHLIVADTIQGELLKIDRGTYFVYFDNKVKIPGLYRILHYEEHPKHGTFIFVSSFTPNLSWLIWKPPFDKSNLLKSYEYALQKKKLFTKIGVDPDNILLTNPSHLIEMISWSEFVNK